MLPALFLLVLVLGVENASAVPLLTNGGFETGDLTGWTATNVSVLGTHSGVNPTEGAFMAVLSPGGVFDASLSQDFSPGGFAEVTISFDYNLQALDLFPLVDFGTDSLTAFIGSLQLLSVPLNDVFSGGSTILGWQTFSQTFTSPLGFPPGPFSMAFQVENFPPDGGDPFQLLSAYVDNVSIDAASPVPEPGTLLLMGSGLLGLVGYGSRRRRKTA
jgi:hypothetical protein